MIIKFKDSGEIIELSDNITVPLNLSVADIRNVVKRTGTFSKTIVVPGTKKNNIVLGNNYALDVNDLKFNVRTKKIVELIDNNNALVKDNLILQLISVNKIQKTINIDENIEYELLLKDAVADFFTIIANKELTDISDAKFDLLNHVWNGNAIVNSFTNTYTDGYKYWLPQSTSTSYPIETIPLALYVKNYFDWIHAEAGYSYTFDEATDRFVLFDKLLMTDNKSDEELKKLVTEINTAEADLKVDIDKPIGYRLQRNVPKINLAEFPTNNAIINLNLPNEIRDPSNQLAYVIGTPQSAYDTGFQFANNENMVITSNTIGLNTMGAIRFIKVGTNNVKVTLKGDISMNFYLRTPSPINFELYKNPPSPTLGEAKVKVYLRMFNFTQNTTSLVLLLEKVNDFSIYNGSALNTDINSNIFFNQTVTANTDILVNNNDYIYFDYFVEFVGFPGTIQPVFVFIQSNTTNIVNVDPFFRVSNTSLTISDSDLQLGGNMPVRAWVPKAIKQSDLLKSIYTLYNIYAEADKFNPNTIIYKTRDKFYDEGGFDDWTEILDKESEQTIEPLSELTNKKLRLTYKADTDSANKTYTEATKKIYGQQTVTFDSDFVKDIDTKEIIFSPTPIGFNTIGGTAPIVTNPTQTVRLFIDGGARPTALPLIIFAPNNLGSVTSNIYPQTTHFSGEYGGGLDINFGPCDYYFFPIKDSPFIPYTNLFNLYWRKNAQQINNGKLFTAVFKLNNTIINRLSLADTIRVYNNNYYINKIIDYDANKEGLTKVELITIDDINNVEIQVENKSQSNLVTLDSSLKANRLLETLEENIRQSDIKTDQTVILLNKNMQVGENESGIFIDENHRFTNDNLKVGDIEIFNDRIEISGNTFEPPIYYSEDTFSGIAKLETIDVDYFSTFTTEFTRIAGFSNRLSTNEQSGIQIQPDFINLSLTNGINSNVLSMSLTETVMTLPSYADEADATLAGLNTGALYQTDGTGASPLNVAGIVMIKQ
jgi:hypothetical protein